VHTQLPFTVDEALMKFAQDGDNDNVFFVGLTELGYDTEEFIVLARLFDERSIGAKLPVWLPLMTVDRRDNGRRLTYEAGQGVTWAASALSDIKAGKFGPP
jgi:hypothetical protein